MQFAIPVLLALLGFTANPDHASTIHSDRFRNSSRIAAPKGKRASDAEIRQQIIAASIAEYPGPCACPYQSARNGSSCGRRSAYSRGGGYAPLCYASDVSDDMVRSYRVEHGLD